MTPEPSVARTALRTALFVLMTSGLLIAYFAVSPAGCKARQAVVRTWYRGACRLVGLHVRAHGVPLRDGPVLFVSNHVSYLDVPVLGALVDTTFVAKREVSAWPGIGPLARLVGTVFIGRGRTDVRGQAAGLAARLAGGESLLGFPEGTSTRGHGVLPFKSAFFGIAEHLPGDFPLRVQPVSIAYIRTATGKALVDDAADHYAWYGDMTLVPHLLAVLGLRGAEVEVRFHAPVATSEFADRKAMARHCQAEVAAGVAASNGIWPCPDAAPAPLPPVVPLPAFELGVPGLALDVPAVEMIDDAVEAMG